MKWFSDNWDKLLAVIFGGVVGFFTAVFTIQGKLADVQKDVAKLQTSMDTTVLPKIQSVDSLTSKLNDFGRDLADFQKQNNLSIQTTSYLNLLLTEERKRTVNDLKDLLKEEQKPKQP